MEIAIIGSGALGSIFGGLLHANGEKVNLFDTWDKHVDRINDDGLLIERVDKKDTENISVTPPAYNDPHEIETVDLAFVFVKSHQTQEALRTARPFIDGNTIVITLQNGLTNPQTIENQIHKDNILSGTTQVGADLEGPGHVVLTGIGGTKIGGNNDKAAAQVVNILSNAGIHSKIVECPTYHIWHKQLYGIGTKPIAALTELPSSPLIEFDREHELMRLLIKEGIQIATMKNIDTPDIDELIEENRSNILTNNPDSKSSMLEDIEKKRRTEIDSLNGAIIRYGEELEIPTPYNRFVYSLVKGKEKSFNYNDNACK